MSGRKAPVAVCGQHEPFQGLTAYGVALLKVIELSGSTREWKAFERASEALWIDWRDGLDELRVAGLVEVDAHVRTAAGSALMVEFQATKEEA